MTYSELHKLLKQNDIFCSYETIVEGDINCPVYRTTNLFISDDPVNLIYWVDKIQDILDKEKIPARVDMIPNDDKLIITLK